MNCNRLQTISRIAVIIFLVAILLTVTFLQLMKYMEENTNISSSYDDDKGYLKLHPLHFVLILGNIYPRVKKIGLLKSTWKTYWMLQISLMMQCNMSFCLEKSKNTIFVHTYKILSPNSKSNYICSIENIMTQIFPKSK